MTLFVSDLDGTLLNSNQEISDKTKKVINEFIKKGGLFTVATARPLVSVKKVLSGINLNLPIIISNGVSVYDIKEEKYIYQNEIDHMVTRDIIKMMKSRDINPIVNLEHNDRNRVFHGEIGNEGERCFIDMRGKEDQGRFHEIEDLKINDNNRIFGIIGINTKENIFPVYQEIIDKYDLEYHFGEDIYCEGHYWLEISNIGSTKGNGLEHLKEIIKPSKVVCFGDNLNDLSMFKIADVSCAMANAPKQVKKAATFVIKNNDEDGVAKFLEEYINKDNKNEYN
ncbi:MAG: HAD family hydrolase [Fusobacteriota bacterium]